MRFTFLVHPLGEWQLRFIGARQLSGRILTAPLGKLDFAVYDPQFIHPITRFPRIVGATGAQATGEVVGIPTTPDAMLADQARTVDLLQEAARRHAEQSDLIGLGALAAIVGLRGEELASRLDTPVTTGNSLTCWTAAETTARLMSLLTRSPRFNPRVLLIGLPGTMALGLLTVLLRRGLSVEVYHPRFPKSLVRKLDRIAKDTGRDIPQHNDLNAALRDKGVVVGASSIGGELADADLRPGTVVVDVARPLDTTEAQRRRSDLIVVEGEMISLPAATGEGWRTFWSTVYNLVVGQVDSRVFACLAEPMVLCLEGRAESFSLGRNIDPDRVALIGEMATRHGFGVHAIFQGTQALAEEDLVAFARVPWLP